MHTLRLIFQHLSAILIQDSAQLSLNPDSPTILRENHMRHDPNGIQQNIRLERAES